MTQICYIISVKCDQWYTYTIHFLSKNKPCAVTSPCASIPHTKSYWLLTGLCFSFRRLNVMTSTWCGKHFWSEWSRQLSMGPPKIERYVSTLGCGPQGYRRLWPDELWSCESSEGESKTKPLASTVKGEASPPMMYRTILIPCRHLTLSPTEQTRHPTVILTYGC